LKYSIFFFLLIYSTVHAQFFSEKDIEISKSKFQLAAENNFSSMPMNDLIAEIGKSFIGTEYKGFMLEQDGEEQLVINLSGLDCTTFLENTLTFARLVKMNKTSFDDYKSELTKIRYRDGIINLYPSRLHYFSDWIHNNHQKGLVKDVTKEIGGEPLKFNLNFMSSNPHFYKHLKETPEFISEIKAHEKEINKRVYHFIPKNKVHLFENQILNGDLIACVTDIKGLDIGHVGIAVKQPSGRIHFMHAPQEGSKVEITKMPLPDYLNKVKKHTGIIVLRAVEKSEE
jgi:hypothetical protein